MLQRGGAHVELAGFRRADKSTDRISEAKVTDFGRTRNASFLKRILSVLKIILTLRSYKDIFHKKNIIVARNLEMLAIAICAKTFLFKKDLKPIVIYESLDIHRLLLKKGIIGKVLRGLEGFLCRRSDGLITSSPAFIREYFKPISNVALPIKLVENKVYFAGSKGFEPQQRSTKDDNEPWRIGWFGALRCKVSLEVLCELVKAFPNQIEVILAGKPAYDQMPDFDKVTSQTKGVSFLGAYQYPDDLEKIYHQVDFTWSIDRFEEGQNSTWLLPNRLYEGCLFDAVPIAEQDVATGKYLDELDIGVLISDRLLEDITSIFHHLDLEAYTRMSDSVKNIPKTCWLINDEECKDIVAWMTNPHEKRDS